MQRVLRCYAEGRGKDWEALCLDLDIAVQGESFEEVFRSLHAAIDLYRESLDDLPEADRQRLLYRPVPWRVRLKYLFLVLKGALRGPDDDQHLQHQFTLPVAA